MRLGDFSHLVLFAQDDATEMHQQMAVHIYPFLGSSLFFPIMDKVMSVHQDSQSDLMYTNTFPPSALLIVPTASLILA